MYYDPLLKSHHLLFRIANYDKRWEKLHVRFSARYPATIAQALAEKPTTFFLIFTLLS